MTVLDLIVALEEYPRDMRVVVNGYEGGFDDPTLLVEKVLIDGTKDKSSWWGRHERPNPWDPSNPGTDVLVLAR